MNTFARLSWKILRFFWPGQMLWFAMFGCFVPQVAYKIAEKDHKMALYLPKNRNSLRGYSAILLFFFVVVCGMIIFNPTTSSGKVFIAVIGVVIYVASFITTIIFAGSYQRSRFLWGALAIFIPLLPPLLLYELGTKVIQRSGWPQFQIRKCRDEKLRKVLSFSVGTEKIIEEKTSDAWQRIVLLLLFLDDKEAIQQVDLQQLLCKYKSPVGVPLFRDIDALVVFEMTFHLEKLFQLPTGSLDIENVEPRIVNIANKLKQVTS